MHMLLGTDCMNDIIDGYCDSSVITGVRRTRHAAVENAGSEFIARRFHIERAFTVAWSFRLLLGGHEWLAC